MTRSPNFGAGPGTLPLPALERARDELLDFAGTGASVMELSHRGGAYEAVHFEAEALLRELLAVPDDYDVLFLTGGASQQFAQIPLNFLPSGSSADYVVSGVWGDKAVSEAKLVAGANGGAPRVAADSGTGSGETKTWTRTPERVEPASGAAYLHYTSNETIHGVQYATRPGDALPTFGDAPLVCDMSSDFLWRPTDVRPFSLLYAGAQKNLGPSGVTIVVARKSFLERGRKDLPKFLQYRTHAANRSLYNTPPTLAVYLVRQVLAWTKAQGGPAALERRNREKAALIYGAIDASNGFYACPVARENRSLMNVVFRLPTPALEDALVKRSEAAGMIGLKGHRSVGGLRVSLYNAVSVDWTRALARLLVEFGAAHG